MSGVTFSNIRRSRSGLVEVSVTDDDTSELYFNLGTRHRPADDVVALALATLVGSKYETISYDGLAAPASCRDAIEQMSGSTVSLKVSGTVPRRAARHSVLSFSGGFDSLAAMDMMPEGSKRCSIDFGGRFARERLFFERFDTTIVETNLVDLGLNRNHWEFMFSGAILLHDIFRTDYLASGGVFGVSALELLKTSESWDPKPTPSQTYLGITPYLPVRGLTEAGTAAIVHHKYEHLMLNSLKSLANPTEGKYTRKILMMRAYQASQGSTRLWPEVPNTAKPWYTWGSSFTEDFVSIFMLKYLGVEPVQACYKTPIPPEAIAAAEDLSLSFYLKVFPEQTWGRNNELAPRMLASVMAAGIGLYGRTDFRELEAVVALLRPIDAADPFVR